MKIASYNTGLIIALSITLALLFVYLSITVSPVISIFGFIALIIASILLLNPNLALLSIVALVPIERFGRFTDDNSDFTISLMRIAGILVLGILVFHRLVNREKFLMDKTFFLYLGYCVCALLSIFYTTDFVGTIRACSSVLANLLFFFVVVNLLTTRKLVIQAISVWLAVSILIGAYSIYDWYLGSGSAEDTIISSELDPGKGAQTTKNRWSTIWVDTAELESLSGKSLKRTMGSTSHSAVYGINLVLTIPFILFLLNLPLSTFQKAALWGGMGIIAYNILLTNTRATILLACVVGIMCVYNKLLKIDMKIIFLLVLICISGTLFIPEDVYNRILDSSNYTLEKSASLRIRQEYFFAGISAFIDNWLIGMGLSNENIIPAYLNSWSTAPPKTSAHNEFLQTLMELGIIGAFFLFSFAALLLRYTYILEARFRNNSALFQEYQFVKALKISMIATLIYGLQVDVFHFPLKGWWLIAGITVFMYHWSHSDKK